MNHFATFVSSKRQTLRELISYLLTGGATTLINYAVYLILLHFQADYLAANTIAWIFAVAFAYFSNRIFVFRSENQIGKELLSFVSLRFVTLLMENLLLFLFIRQFDFSPLISKIAVSFVTTAANYILCKCQIFQSSTGCLNPQSTHTRKESAHE